MLGRCSSDIESAAEQGPVEGGEGDGWGTKEPMQLLIAEVLNERQAFFANVYRKKKFFFDQPINGRSAMASSVGSEVSKSPVGQWRVPH